MEGEVQQGTMKAGDGQRALEENRVVLPQSVLRLHIDTNPFVGIK